MILWALQAVIDHLEVNRSFVHNVLPWTLNRGKINFSFKIWFRAMPRTLHMHQKSMKSSIYKMRFLWRGKTNLEFYVSFRVEPGWGFLFRTAKAFIIWASPDVGQRRKGSLQGLKSVSQQTSNMESNSLLHAL